jgi:hypothetical protein
LLKAPVRTSRRISLQIYMSLCTPVPLSERGCDRGYRPDPPRPENCTVVRRHFGPPRHGPRAAVLDRRQQRTCPSSSGPRRLAANGSPEPPSTASRTTATSSKPRARAFGSGTPAGDSGGRLDRREPASLEQPAISEYILTIPIAALFDCPALYFSTGVHRPWPRARSSAAHGPFPGTDSSRGRST